MQAKDVFKNTLVVLVTLAAAYILVLNIRVLVILLIAIIIASAIRPSIIRLTKWGIPEGVALLLVYLTIALLVFILIAIVVPPIANQFSTYLQHEDRLANRIISAQNWVQSHLQSISDAPVVLADPASIRTGISDLVDSLQDSMPTLLSNLGSTIGDTILVFVMGVYWLTSIQKAITFITELFRVRDRERVQAMIFEIETMMGTYVRGVSFVAAFVGTANFLILALLGVPNAATLGFISGVGTLLPVIGGFLGGGLATLLALLSSPVHGVITFATFVGVQQIEVHYLTPRMMSRSVGVDPLLVMVAVFVGFTLYGVIGALIAVPILGTVALLLRYLVIEPRKVSVSAYKTEAGAVLIEDDTEVPEKPKPSVILPS